MANRLPLHERHVAAGAKFESFADWELPVAYGNPAEEYALVRRGVGLLDRGHFGLLELTGRDRAAFLHALVSNEVKALGPGQGCAATLLDVYGKVQRSEEHTSELQSQSNLVCRLLLEKKKKKEAHIDHRIKSHTALLLHTIALGGNG